MLGKNNQILLAVHIFKIDWKLMILIKKAFTILVATIIAKPIVKRIEALATAKLDIPEISLLFPCIYTRKVSLHILGKFPCIY